MKISQEYLSKSHKQDYSKKKVIDGVIFKEILQFSGEDGYISELVRLEGGKVRDLPNFQPLQVNRSVLLPGGVKAWHFHLNQEDLWYVAPEFTLLVGLLDLREDSSTYNVSMRFALGGGKSQLLYIPRGVGHGCANTTADKVEILYFVNQHFSATKNDENRLPWDILGTNFWQMVKD